MIGVLTQDNVLAVLPETPVNALVLVQVVTGFVEYCHWYVGLIAVATTENELAVFWHTVAGLGCVVNTGEAFTVTVTLLEVRTVGHVSVTKTS